MLMPAFPSKLSRGEFERDVSKWRQAALEAEHAALAQTQRDLTAEMDDVNRESKQDDAKVACKDASSSALRLAKIYLSTSLTFSPASDF